jgi:hypothetical protein
MSLKNWERKVLAVPGAGERVAEIEDELRLSAGLTALHAQAGLSQRELANGSVYRRRVSQRSNVLVTSLSMWSTATSTQLVVSSKSMSEKEAARFRSSAGNLACRARQNERL